MAEPQRDLSQIFGRLQYGQRASVPHNVREYPLCCQRGAMLPCRLDMFAQDVFEARTSQGFTARTDEQFRHRHGSPYRQPSSERRCSCFPQRQRSEEHTSELQSRGHLVCRLLLEKKKSEREMSYLSRNAFCCARRKTSWKASAK